MANPIREFESHRLRQMSLQVIELAGFFFILTAPSTGGRWD